jgi:hypothetical protein
LFFQLLSQYKVILGPLFGSHGFDGLSHERPIAGICGLNQRNQQICSRHGPTHPSL